MNPWSVFWRHGHSTTFGDYFKQGYDGAVAEWWQSYVRNMDPGTKILEVGCGNCSLLPFLVRSRKRAKYIGVDLAAIKVSDIAREGLDDSDVEVVLYGETPAEHLPVEDQSVDLVASVFGIEYSNLDQSLGEVHRALRPGGKFVALLHHATSVVTSMSKRAISEYDDADFQSIVRALRTISKAREATPSLSELKHNADAERSRATLNRLAEKYLSDTKPATANATMFELMTNALKFFKILGAGSEDRQQFIESLHAEHTASRERFDQMVSVAFDDNRMREFEEKLSNFGFTNTELRVIHTNDSILAWDLCTEKPSQH
jgi:ubiquinone/menaquinone biosynthesis C-methylase UbiE